MEKGQQFSAEFDAIREGLLHPVSGIVDQRAVKIISTADIAVHTINGRAYSSDGTVVLPIRSLGFDYMVFTHHERSYVAGSTLNHTILESSMVIAAVEDNTEIEITPSIFTESSNPQNIPFKIKLNAGQTYQLKADGDLTGTTVKVLNDGGTNCKKIALFSGNRMTSSARCGTTGDHLFQHTYPTSTWGKSYIHIPLKDRTSGEFVKVLAKENGTEVFVNGVSKGRLDAGKQLRLEFGKNEVAYITTSKPSAVAVLSKSGFCNEFFAASLGDPTFFQYSPNEQLITNAPFSTGKLYGRFNLTVDHFVNLIVPKKSEFKTLLNGQSIGNQFKPVPGTDFSYAQFKVPEGANWVSNPDGLIGYVYGSGQIESYGYSIGTGLENIQYEADSKYSFEVIGEKVACLGEEGIWEINPENPIFTQFTWSFGDQTSTKDGKSVKHTFAKPGKYLVSVFATSGSGKCDEEETFRFEVEVKESTGKLEGPVSVCPFGDEIVYTLKDTSNVSKVNWEVKGGDILEESLLSVKVLWKSPNPDGLVLVQTFTDEGCPGKPIELKVEVTDEINPALPIGPSGLCGGETILAYSAPYPNADHKYLWEISGGKIISGQNSPEIKVEWDLQASEKWISYEETSKKNSQCFGVSEKLEVKLYPEFKIEKFNSLPPACPGESNGEIEIFPTGGSGTYVFTWSHDSKLKSAKAKGLSSGKYEVKVEDKTGCAVETLLFELEEPLPLKINGAIETNPTNCDGGEDGEAILKITGGNPPYMILGKESSWDGNRLSVFGLAAGKQNLLLQDERGCTLEVPVEISSPEPIQVLAKVENPGCEGSLDGVLELEISGGTGPYQVIWDDGRTGSRIEELPFGEYSYTVQDANGCVLRGSARVNQALPEVRMPTGFNPKEGAYGPVSNCSVSFEMWIWDRWGNLVFKGSDGWNGKIKDTEAPISTYSYLIQYTYQLEGSRKTSEKSGTFTLIR
ncbi:PKD domain-containing protein [Algoriphagus boseongensis]|uniref:PKD domain-containing protein n=1 Tax=Algoriphagus boseongensis TaxID=1442587 RepID=UPI001414D9E1|nr:PKD domain-containing protein [Algoriphagus boseongensis]